MNLLPTSQTKPSETFIGANIAKDWLTAKDGGNAGDAGAFIRRPPTSCGYRSVFPSDYLRDASSQLKGLRPLKTTENLLLIDVNRNIRGIYNGLNNTSVGYLMDDIETLKAEMAELLVCH